MIALSKFLSDDALIALAAKPSQVICLSLESYAPLFCRSVVDYVSKKIDRQIISQSMSADAIGQQMAGLQATFLGQSFTYWLHADAALSKKESDEWHAFLATYNGPHTLIFATVQPELKYPRNWCVIAFPAEIDSRSFKQVSLLFDAPANTSFAELLFDQVRALPLDTAVMLYHYGALVGKNTKP
jgi:hypothetical protein